jgi:hypothetical protein
MDPVDQVRHDAASLYRFVEDICAFCSADSKYPAYLEANKKFLSHIAELGTATKEYLSSFPSKLPNSPADYKVYRQELATLRGAWSEIHKRVKPAGDADLLHLPAPLICGLLRKLRSAAEFKDVELAVFHTEQLNYLQVIATNFRDTVGRIGSMIPGSKPLPPTLGLVGIPYSQSASLFLNCLIAHELGHFIFGEMQLKTALAPDIYRILNNAFGPVASSLTSQQKNWIPTIVTDWAEELFCDLFAVFLVGPCYTYAFIEILDVANILKQDGKLDPSAAATHFQFSESHPAILFRLQQQVLMLEKLGWWAEVNSSTSHYMSVLKSSKALTPTEFSFPMFQATQANSVAAAVAISSVVSAMVENTLKTIDCGVSEFNRLREPVSEYLRHGVVPSSVPDPKTHLTVHPSPVTVLNVAYQLYLDEFNDLIRSIAKQDPSSVADRNKWIQRLEMWAMKALDDYELLERQRENKGKA